MEAKKIKVEVQKFEGRLKTVKNMSHELRVSVVTIHNRIKRGELLGIVIDGVHFVVV
jgi:hypothetical protein